VFFNFNSLQEHCRVVRNTEKRKDLTKETFDLITLNLNFSENGSAAVLFLRSRSAINYTYELAETSQEQLRSFSSRCMIDHAPYGMPLTQSCLTAYRQVEVTRRHRHLTIPQELDDTMHSDDCV
jgi:hypothetical protein